MTVDAGYVELLVAHQPVKPRNRRELAEMTGLLEALAANETRQTPAMERLSRPSLHSSCVTKTRLSPIRNGRLPAY